MKSKAEVIEALKCHMSGNCSKCSYRDEWHACNPTPERGLFADILALLNKSDFETIRKLVLQIEYYIIVLAVEQLRQEERRKRREK